MARVRPVEAGLSAFGPIAQMAPAWPKLRSRSSAAASWQRCAAECVGRAAPAERGTERFLQRQSALQGLCKGAAGPSGAANHIHQRTLQASAALAAAATLARQIRWRQSRSICRPQAAQQKKTPVRYKRHLTGIFSSRLSPRHRPSVLYHTAPGFVKASTASPETGPSPRGGRWVGLSLAPSLSTSAALRSKPPTTGTKQKIAARELTKSAGRDIITARSSISLNMRLLAQIWQNFATKCI